MASNGRVTLQDIADATGLSPASVSFALNNRQGVSDETRQRVLEAAERLGYQRSSRRGAEPTTVTVVVERLPVAPSSDPFNRPILAGLEASARRHGHRIAMEFVGPEEQPDPERWGNGDTAGVVVLGGGDLSPVWVRAAAETHLPTVMVDHFVPGLDLPAVVPDNLTGAYEATRYLLGLGHRRIGFIQGPGKYWTLSERLAGYLLAMHQAGCAHDDLFVPPRVSHGEDKGYGETLRLLDLPEPPSAVFAVSDKTAIGAYRAARERGLRIPDDISVLGFDDIDLARLLDPPLTTVHIPGETIGRVAFERLHRQMAGMERELPAQMRWSIATRLVVRRSVGPGPHAEAGKG